MVTLVAAAGAVAVTAASASQLIDRNATAVKLEVNARGEALLTYLSNGRLRHVLAWGALNALPSTEGTRQVAFKLDYSGGYRKYFKDNPAAQRLASKYTETKGTPGYRTSSVARELQQVERAAGRYWKTGFGGSCGSYDGPALAGAVAECKAPNGSYWAVQAWQRELPDYGVTPQPKQLVWELRLSHWTGALPVLTVGTNWSWHRWDHLYGTLTYDGQPVFGFRASSGTPLDGFGRNVYIDTLNSAYGPGWRREGSALTHLGTGVFCYSVNPHGSQPAGTGSAYRVTVIGPGVTPDLMWSGPSPGPYSAAADAVANEAIAALDDNACRPN